MKRGRMRHAKHIMLTAHSVVPAGLLGIKLFWGMHKVAAGVCVTVPPGHQATKVGHHSDLLTQAALKHCAHIIIS